MYYLQLVHIEKALVSPETYDFFLFYLPLELHQQVIYYDRSLDESLLDQSYHLKSALSL